MTQPVNQTIIFNADTSGIDRANQSLGELPDIVNSIRRQTQQLNAETQTLANTVASNNANLLRQNALLSQAQKILEEEAKTVAEAERRGAIELEQQRVFNEAIKERVALQKQLAEQQAQGARDLFDQSPQTLDQVRGRLEAIDTETRQIQESFKNGGIAVAEFERRIESLQGEYRRLNRIAGQFDESGVPRGRVTGRRGGRGTLGSIGTAIRDLPAIPIGTTGFTTEVPARLLQGLDQFGVTLRQLAITGTAVAAVFIPLAIGFNRIRNALKELGEAIERDFLARTNVALSALDGTTEENAREQIEKLKARQAVLNELIAEGEADRVAQVERTSEIVREKFVAFIQGIVSLFGKAFQAILDLGVAIVSNIGAIIAGDKTIEQLGAQIGLSAIEGVDELLDKTFSGFLVGGLDDALENLRDEASETDAQIRALANGLQEGTFAANSAAQASRDLALAEADRTERLTRAGLEASNTINDLERQLFNLQNGIEETQNPIQQRIDALILERTVLEAQIQSLQSSGDTSKEVTQRLNELRVELGLVGEEIGIFRQELPKANQLVKAIDAERKRQEAQREVEQELKRIEQAEKRYAEALEKARQQLADTIEDIRRKLGDDLQEAFIKSQQTIADAVAETNAIAVVEAQKELRREQARLRRDAARAERDARIDFERRIRDAQLDLQRQYSEASIDLERRTYQARLQAQAGQGVGGGFGGAVGGGSASINFGALSQVLASGTLNGFSLSQQSRFETRQTVRRAIQSEIGNVLESA